MTVCSGRMCPGSHSASLTGEALSETSSKGAAMGDALVWISAAVFERVTIMLLIHAQVHPEEGKWKRKTWPPHKLADVDCYVRKTS
eukprot:478523-Amphidinium_carterae.1